MSEENLLIIWHETLKSSSKENSYLSDITISAGKFLQFNEVKFVSTTTK